MMSCATRLFKATCCWLCLLRAPKCTALCGGRFANAEDKSFNAFGAAERRA